MKPLADLEEELHRLVDEGRKEDIVLRVIGGLAIKVHSPHAEHRALERDYPDLDFITDGASGIKLMDFFPAMGYEPNMTMNTLSGDWRQQYFDEEHDRQVDVFIKDFEMCHAVPIAHRLHVEPVTIPLAELFLTKAQIVELNQKDAFDLLTLLLDHDVGHEDEETINLDVIADLCAGDWGLYTTVSMNVDRLSAMLDNGTVDLGGEKRETIKERLTAIQQAMAAAPKSMGWKLRAKVGKRVRWYEEVEEVRR